jgi:sec-independent protein translocase protein TatC
MSASSALPNAPGGPERKRRSPFAYLQALKSLRARKRTATQESMTILQHLDELRLRLTKIGIALLVGIALSFLYSTQLLDWLTVPIGGRTALASIEITENISAYMQVTLLTAVVFSFPFVLHQIVAYVAPGLTPSERRWLYALVPLGTLFFLLGVAFAWLVMIPAAMPMLVGFLDIPTHPRPLNYLGFVTSLLFWIGISFEMPLIIFFFAKLKWVTAGQLLRGWRYAFMAIATLAALVTPTVDPINMGIVMIPLWVLYLLSIGFARFAA